VSTYREIIGKKIKKVSSDPSSGTEGEMWYNSTTGTLRGPAIIEAWSSAASLSTGRAQAGGNGTQDSALICGGYTTAVTAVTEEYNGSGWAAGGNLTTSRSSLRSAGTQTSAIAFGGYKPSPGYITVTESYNGTSWTNSPAIGTGRTGGAQAGTSTAALYAGGGTPGVVNNSEEYNGSSWSEGDNLNTARTVVGGSGIQTAALAAGGELGPPGYTGATELYDGTSWTTSPASLNVIKGGQGQNGTQTSSLAYGGYTGTAVTGATESYNGTTWTNLSPIALATPRNATQGAGADNGSAVCFGGDPQKSETEEFTSSTNIITAAAWAAGGALNTGRMNVSCGGTQTASILVGGHISPGGTPSGVELYDGSSWTTSGTVPYTADYGVYAGTSTSGIQIGGAPYTTTSAELSGTSWTAGGSLNTGRSQLMGAGTQTAGLAFGGYTDATTETAVTEEYNGTAFSNSPNSMSLARGRGAGFGIQTAALCVAGSAAPSETHTNATEEYNGTSWTAGGNYVNSNGSFLGGFGTQTDGIAVGGGTPSYVATAAGYDGTSWSTRPSAAYAAGRTQTAGANGSAGLRAGGGPNTSQRDGSEEWTGETSAASIENFTTS